MIDGRFHPCPTRTPSAMNAAVLGVGVASLDIVLEVAAFPREDGELRILSRRRALGGNAANTLVVLSQLGHSADWMGVMGGGADAGFLLAELGRAGVGHQDAVRVPVGGTPTSYVCLSRASGSRTILHHRDLPELSAEQFAQVPLAGLDWVHFEGRNPAETAAMVRRVREERPEVRLSLELEKPRPGIKQLFAGPEVLLLGRGFAEAWGASDPGSFLRAFIRRTSARACFLGWGSEGGYAATAGGQVFFSPAFPPPRVVDTLGAGDVFNAGIIDALLAGRNVAEALERGCRLAGRRCGQVGLDGLGRAPVGPG